MHKLSVGFNFFLPHFFSMCTMFMLFRTKSILFHKINLISLQTEYFYTDPMLVRWKAESSSVLLEMLLH